MNGNKIDAQREAPDHDTSIAIFVTALVEAFGADAHSVIERQIELAEGEPLAKWVAIREHLAARTTASSGPDRDL